MKSIKIVFAVVLLAVLLVCVGCERSKKEMAERATIAGMPEYGVTGQTSMVRAVSHIEEVMPKGKGPDGKAVYAKVCAACHQATGAGIPAAFPPLDGSKYVVGENVENMAAIMLYGLMGPITVKGAQFNSVMAPLGATLSDEQLAAVATYVRASWSNKAGQVDASVFSKMRKKWGSRSMLTISELEG